MKTVETSSELFKMTKEFVNEGDFLCILNPYRSDDTVYVAFINNVNDAITENSLRWLKFEPENILSVKTVSMTRVSGALLPIALVKLNKSTRKRMPTIFEAKVEAIKEGPNDNLLKVASKSFNFTNMPLRSSDGDVILRQISGWFSEDGRYRCEASGNYDSVWGDTYKLTFFIMENDSVIFSSYHDRTYSGYDDIREIYEGYSDAVKINFWKANRVRFEILDI